MKLSCICTILAISTLAAAPSMQLDTLPKVLRQRAPNIPSTIENSPAEVEVLVEINEVGDVINASIKSATDPRLAVPCLKAIRKWRYEPAQKDGAPVPASFVQPFRFGQTAPEPAAVASAPPRARRRIAPIIPEGLERQEAQVMIAINLGADGRIEDVQVIESTNPLFEEATVDAALQWTFTPAIQSGFPVSSRVHIPFHYLGDPHENVQPGALVQVAKHDASRRE